MKSTLPNGLRCRVCNADVSQAGRCIGTHPDGGLDLRCPTCPDQDPHVQLSLLDQAVPA